MELLRTFFEDADWWMHALTLGMLGWAVGVLAVPVTQFLVGSRQWRKACCLDCQQKLPLSTRLRPRLWGQIRCPSCSTGIPRWIADLPLVYGAAFAAYGYFVIDLQAQQIEQVLPYEIWRYGRVAYHLVLVTLLVTATATDLIDYTISDWITIPGILIGLAGAVISGDLQTVHLWIDWNQEQIFRGAYIPQWIADHHHLHGLAWSLAGAAYGALGTWLLRFVSRLVMGEEALGFGDVTLMAMIGSFLGWQPMTFVFIGAPLLAATLGSVIPLITRKPYLPFGPFLSLAAYVVMLSWKWLWEPTRYVFGHWQSLLLLAGAAGGGTVILLSLFRAARSIPTDRVKAERKSASQSETAEDSVPR